MKLAHIVCALVLYGIAAYTLFIILLAQDDNLPMRSAVRPAALWPLYVIRMQVAR